MAFSWAKKAAGTYVSDQVPATATGRWLTQQCREGSLAPAVKRFCESQSEILDPGLVQVVEVAPDHLKCRLPFRGSDHESEKTFEAEVWFNLDPVSGTATRT